MNTKPATPAIRRDHFLSRIAEGVEEARQHPDSSRQQAATRQ